MQRYDKDVWFDYVTQYDYDQFQDEALKRRFKNMAVLGVAALEPDQLSQVLLLCARQLNCFKILHILFSYCT
jgi:hypothetical protein